MTDLFFFSEGTFKFKSRSTKFLMVSKNVSAATFANKNNKTNTRGRISPGMSNLFTVEIQQILSSFGTTEMSVRITRKSLLPTVKGYLKICYLRSI